MTDDDKALDKIIRTSMPLDFERKETLSDDKALVERLRWSDGWFFENPWDHVVYASDDPLEAADRIEAQAAEIETLKTMIFATGEAAAVNLRTAMERALEIERLREALTQIARLRTDLRGDFSLGSKQSDIARVALGETNG